MKSSKLSKSTKKQCVCKNDSKSNYFYKSIMMRNMCCQVSNGNRDGGVEDRTSSILRVEKDCLSRVKSYSIMMSGRGVMVRTICPERGLLQQKIKRKRVWLRWYLVLKLHSKQHSIASEPIVHKYKEVSLYVSMVSLWSGTPIFSHITDPSDINKCLQIHPSPIYEKSLSRFGQCT